MSVERDLTIRLVTNLDYFPDIVEVLLNEGFSFNEDGKVMSLSEDDLDEYDYIFFDSYAEVKIILNKRGDRGYNNYILIWENRIINDSIIIRSIKRDDKYNGYKNHYEIKFGIGYGERIKGAERYTDYGIYLNRILPIFIKHSMYICEINCCDFDC